MALTAGDLRKTLQRIDGKGYKAYKDIAGSYDFGDGLSLFIDYVQGDPFAAPSKVRVRMEQSVAGFPPPLFDTETRRLALSDFIARETRRAIRGESTGRRGSGKSGLVAIDAGQQEVLPRTAVFLTESFVEARLEVGLPAAGRKVLGRQAEELLCEGLVDIAEEALLWKNTPADKAQAFVECVENQETIRAALKERKLVAFVADGSLLPRESGASDRPLKREEAVFFDAPEALAQTIGLPNEAQLADGTRTREMRGMGIPEGVTLIAGGGYHGKSTLLEALQRCVYPHIPGDGREYVVTRNDAVKIRAEDGRRVERVDIAAFISDLPGNRATGAFCSDDASGSTSQAANIVEALETGCSTLLLDEDTSATNFMVRDARMQSLVHKEFEPITPFLDRVRELHERLGVSTVLVMGGSGDYFDVADTVLLMREYRPSDATGEARRIAQEMPSSRALETPAPLRQPAPRVPLAQSFSAAKGKKDVKIKGRDVEEVVFGEDAIDLRSVEQLVDPSQTRAIGYAIHLATKFMDGRASLAEVLDQVEAHLREKGLERLDPFHRNGAHPGNFAMPRREELAAAINRLRTCRMKQAEE
ncbi:MAG: ABC-ATPase domain-containing protein [Candidatus Hydrogenedentota bacterium]